MPIYEYTCMKCKKDFEYIVFGRNDSVTCPKCESGRVKRRMSACSFRSQGSASSASDASSSSGCSSCAGGSCATCR